MRAIVLYPYPPEPDGQSLQGHLLYRGLVENGYEVYPSHFSKNMQKTFYLKNLKPDVAFSVGFWGNVPDVIREPLNCGVPPVPWFNADGWVANYKEEFEKLELMFTTSEWVRSVYKRDGVDVSKIIPMHIGVDTSVFKPFNNPEFNKKIREMLGIKEDEKMILTIGGDVTSKGAQEMFKALAKLDKEFPKWKYVCKAWPSDCAYGWKEHEMKLIEELGIKDKVVYLYDIFPHEFMAYLLNACDIYAAPSRLEGFGMIQVEAMACGKPVISINKMGPSETILHGKTGFLAKVGEEVLLEKEWVYQHMGFSKKQLVQFKEPKVFGYRADIDELAKYTLTLLTEPELCQKMGEEGRKHTVNNLDYKIIAKKMVDITQKKLGIK